MGARWLTPSRGPVAPRTLLFVPLSLFFFDAGFTLLTLRVSGATLALSGCVVGAGVWPRVKPQQNWTPQTLRVSPGWGGGVGCVTPHPKHGALLPPQKGYDDLQAIVPTCQQQDFSIGSQKLSKAIVLQKSES